MLTQKFKGDAFELEMEAAGQPATDVTGTALDDYFENGYTSDPFLLALYDSGRMPFSDRVPRDSFVSFIKQAIPNFPNTGTFEAYIFIIDAIFGAGSGVLFNVPAAGKLEMLVNAASTIYFDFQARQFSGGTYTYFEMVDWEGATLQFQGISGIDSEAELAQLLSELIPAGIFPDITLAFFALYDFVSSDGYQIIDYLGNQIAFIET